MGILILGKGKRFVIYLQRSNRLWGPPNLLSNGYQMLFHPGHSEWGVKLNTHLYLVPRLRMRGAVSPLPHIFSWRRSINKYGGHFTFTPCYLEFKPQATNARYISTPHSTSISSYSLLLSLSILLYFLFLSFLSGHLNNIR
jgi:hypothetical protein